MELGSIQALFVVILMHIHTWTHISNLNLLISHLQFLKAAISSLFHIEEFYVVTAVLHLLNFICSWGELVGRGELLRGCCSRPTGRSSGMV
jgi:hypothetical protein